MWITAFAAFSLAIVVVAVRASPGGSEPRYCPQRGAGVYPGDLCLCTGEEPLLFGENFLSISEAVSAKQGAQMSDSSKSKGENHHGRTHINP